MSRKTTNIEAASINEKGTVEYRKDTLALMVGQTIDNLEVLEQFRDVWEATPAPRKSQSRAEKGKNALAQVLGRATELSTPETTPVKPLECKNMRQAMVTICNVASLRGVSIDDACEVFRNVFPEDAEVRDYAEARAMEAEIWGAITPDINQHFGEIDYFVQKGQSPVGIQFEISPEGKLEAVA